MEINLYSYLIIRILPNFALLSKIYLKLPINLIYIEYLIIKNIGLLPVGANAL
jgi:hypothetical protein